MKGIIDTTLREGAQTVGVSFSFTQKLAIVEAVSQCGIEEIELGIATRLDTELHGLLAASRKIARQTSFSLWCRCNDDDITFAATLMPDTLSLSIPVSDLHIEKKFGRNRAWVEKRVKESIQLAARCGIRKISLGLEDATRASHDFLETIISLAAENGAHRIRFADTVGIATPMTIVHLLQSTHTSGLEIGVHAHNDFGMATANALTALENGADWADTTVLGIGERAGNARLEEVAGFLALRAGRSYRTEKLSPLCQLVSEAASKAIDPHHPVVGKEIFACETGLHLQGLEKDPATYEPYNPKEVGAVRRLIYGQKIGRHSLSQRLAHLNLPSSPGCINKAFTIFKAKSKELGRPLKDHELASLFSL